MKKLLPLAIAVVLVAIIAVTIVRAQNDSSPTPPPTETHATDRREPPERPHEGMRQRQLEWIRGQAAELKAMYDENQDGTLDEAERVKLEADLAIAERLGPFLMTGKILKEADADGNFEISPEEAAKIPEALEKFRPMRGPGGPGGRPHGGPGGRPHGGPGGRPHGGPGGRPHG